MARRLLEVVVPEPGLPEVLELLGEHPLLGKWRDVEKPDLLVKALIPAEETEAIMDQLQRRFSHHQNFRVVLLPVEAEIPPPPAPPEPDEAEQAKRHHRISRQELYGKAVDSIKLSPVFVAMTVLSAVVAAVGLLRDNVAVVIGAMVIAPLLSPNVTLALGTTLGDAKLIRDAMKANLLGISIALAFSILVGLVFPVDPTVPAIAARTTLGSADLVLALAAGVAGTLALTSGLPGAVIGVMVAVALLPPLVNFGLLVGGGQWRPASGAFLLLVANVVCVNLAGVSTFLVQGVRPISWWEAERARRATRLAIIIWTGLLALLALTLVLSRPGQF